ncbi:hypothetical protein QQF64_006060 [Cirrhinus molitorella]|uniref:Uncharacterized protein n=1 Tax=Cirrhinus molitorella TaxID=172907 RepID=A0ABR3MG78_9TELE
MQWGDTYLKATAEPKRAVLWGLYKPFLPRVKDFSRVALPTGQHPIMSAAPEVTEPDLQTLCSATSKIKWRRNEWRSCHSLCFCIQASVVQLRCEMPPAGSQTMTVRGIYSDIYTYELHNDMTVKY